MTFDALKKSRLKPQKELGLFTFLTALVVACALFVPYMIMGEGYFIFYGDFNVQQIPFYKMCHAAVKSGSFNWSFTTDLGSNFVGSYSFYLLGSPFFWLTIPFPNSFVPYLMGPLLILKFACAAFTSYLFIRRFTRTSYSAMLGALLYAFSGFSVYNIFFNHFHEAIIVFPLLLYSLELLLTEKKRGVFAATVALCAVINYFFFFGMVVFCVIYYFVRLFSKAYEFKISSFLQLLLEAVLGVALSAFLLLPSIAAIGGNERISNLLYGWNAILYGKEQIYLNILQCFFFPPDLPARPVFFPGAGVKWASLGGWLPLVGMTGVITWLSVKKKSWISRLIGICIFMAAVPILNSAFYNFNDAYYARWFYMPILIMCLATAFIFEDSTADLFKGYKWTAAITITLSLVIGLFPDKDANGKLTFGLFTKDTNGLYFARFWINVIIAAISLVVVWTLYYFFKNERKQLIRLTTIGVIIVSIVYGNIFIAFGKSHSYNEKTVIIDSLIESDLELDGNKDTFRIDTYDCVDNTGMFLGYSTMNAFHSVVSPSIMDFYKFIGIKRDVGSRADLSYPALRPLLSVKYMLTRNGGKSFINDDGETLLMGYKKVKKEGGYTVYKNENYIGYGFSYDYAMSQDFCEMYPEKSRANLMLKAILLSDKDMKKYEKYFCNLSEVADTVTATEETEEEQELSNELFLEEETEDMGLTSVNMALTEREMTYDAKRLKKTAALSFETDNYGFTSKVMRDKKTLVFYSIPYDEGWTATVNGKPVEIIRANVGFMAVPVDSGLSTIRFNYKTPLLDTGLYITGGALVILLLYLLIMHYVFKDKAENYCYPEGDELLAYWHAAEISESISDGESENRYDEPQPDLKEPLQENKKDSLLDGLGDIRISEIKPQIDGGFKINTDLFKDK